MTQPAFIVGAGLAGLIAAHAWPQALVIEASSEPGAAHRALLRFRSDAVARLTGIEFTKVRVHKGIWHNGAFVAPSIAVANLYSQKVLGGRLANDRSIWSVEPVDRWVAPDDLYEQLLFNVGHRVRWGASYDWGRHKGDRATDPVVSTAPMSVVAREFGLVHPEAVFPRAAIDVLRVKVPRAKVFQTVYFPDPDKALYRASITGDTLICEYVAGWKGVDFGPRESWDDVIAAFGLNPFISPEDGERVQQKYGKISAVDDNDRRKVLFELTHRHGIYSLGRFATWRNILLDDVVNDIDVIKRLMRNADGYALAHAA